MVSSLAKKTGDASTADSHRTCSNERSRENKCSNSKTPIVRGRAFSKEPICYGCRQEGK